VIVTVPDVLNAFANVFKEARRLMDSFGWEEE